MAFREHLDTVFDVATECVTEGDFTVRIQGSCMAPTLNDGDQVTLSRPRLLLPGDVIVFRTKTTLVAHRLIGWAPLNGGIGFVTQGDHCDRHDGVVGSESVLGRVELEVGFRKRASAFLSFVSLVLRRLKREQ